MNRAGEAEGGFPWAWLMYHALDLGFTRADFWDLCPRAILCVQEELTMSLKRVSGGKKGKSGSYDRGETPPAAETKSGQVFSLTELRL